VRFTVTRKALIASNAPNFDDKQRILSVLQDLGAPIVGKLYLRVDERFSVTALPKEANGDATYIFKEKPTTERQDG
jgi:hypothetical protein